MTNSVAPTSRLENGMGGRRQGRTRSGRQSSKRKPFRRIILTSDRYWCENFELLWRNPWLSDMLFTCSRNTSDVDKFYLEQHLLYVSSPLRNVYLYKRFEHPPIDILFHSEQFSKPFHWNTRRGPISHLPISKSSGLDTALAAERSGP